LKVKGIVVLIGILIGVSVVGAILFNEKVVKEKRAQEVMAMGEGLEQQENYELAQEEYQRGYDRYAGTLHGPVFLFRAAVCLRKRGDIEAAVERLQEWLERYPEDERVADCLAELGSCAEEAGNPDQAQEYYQKILDEHRASPRRGDALAAVGDMLVGQAQPEQARELLQEVLERYPDSAAAERAMDALGKANLQILFSPRPQEGCVRYDVQKGDSLASIADKFGTTVSLIKECNGLNKDWIRPGQTLKVVQEPFGIEVDLSEKMLILDLRGAFFKRYPVGVGRYDTTPIGEFEVIEKVKNPTWYPSTGGVFYPGDPQNILGTRWLALSKPGYGIHGTTEPESIGKASSAGCIRMLNRHVEELYTLVPVGTSVRIVQ